MTYYELRYEYEGCFDDGGIGHDSGFSKSAELIAAGTDLSAQRKAMKFIRERRARAKPCGSFGCSNRGRTRVLGLRRITHEEAEVPLPKAASVGFAL